ncbi:hypothetical protein L207DRAFT_515719 [Hyaloscypha variabilis F]|uniref:F-box domain-containing protein n=1 Tax=Hyaloscypha variabilis (strain UAMH 11265 / GT02V1 / F) TaxID=1149755 RepID=A0A2J6RBU3_HYAVF|nr:hypothetical protein L207DRAFT_515719 [Hyaloscypha variabilis F]
MGTFLGLPRELRNEILTFVLLHQDEAPTDVSDASGRAELDDIDSLGSKRDYVLSVEQYPPRNSTSLLLLSRQLHDETQKLITLLPTKSYVLDVIIANETKLWAT